jgi:PAS domain S-box-containing protein
MVFVANSADVQQSDLHDMIRKLEQEVARRKQAELALTHGLAVSEAALKELADQKFALDQHAIVAVTDIRGKITYVNERFCAISQYSRGELIGQNHRILNSGQHSREFFQQMYQTIANGKTWSGEIKNRAKDGSIYWVDTTIVPTSRTDGKPCQYVAIRADITKRKLVEQALARQALELSRRDEELACSNVELEQFAYVASHDLQEPLRTIANYTQLLAERYRDKLDEQADKYIAYSVDGALRMQSLIRDLLEFSRVGKAEIKPRPTDCGTVVEEALRNLRAAVKESGALVNCNGLPVVLADPFGGRRLDQTQLTERNWAVSAT